MYSCIIIKNKSQGFSLVEVMIALLIFAIVTMMCAKGINSIIVMKTKQQEAMNKISEIQMIHFFLQKDLTQAVMRPVRINNDITPAFIGGNKTKLSNELFELTRMGVSNPNIRKRALSSLRRTGYFLNKNTFTRKSWVNINQIEKQTPIKKILSDNVKQIKINYITVEGISKNNWRSIYPVNLNTTGNTWHLEKVQTGLPVALTVLLTMKNNEQFNWWFSLPGGRRIIK